MKDKRVRINKRFMASSDGVKTNIIPSLRRKVDDYGKMIIDYQTNLEEGYEIEVGSCATVREECRCREHEADHYWEHGRHLEALNEMMLAAMYTLPDERYGYEFEDVQWLNPDETLYWHPNIKEFIRLVQRCRDYCKLNPKLWPVFNGSSVDRDYRKYIGNLHCWRYDASNETYRNCW